MYQLYRTSDKNLGVLSLLQQTHVAQPDLQFATLVQVDKMVSAQKKSAGRKRDSIF